MITQSVALLLAATTMAAPVTKWHTAPPFPLPAGATDTILQDVTAAVPGEVWFAGSWRDSGGTLHPLTARWSGSAWRPVPAPGTQILTAIDAVGAGDVWAVGSTTEPGDSTPVVLHYVDSAWSAVPTEQTPADSALADVDLRTADDGWAAGTSGASPLILRWSSERWTRTPVPDLGAPARLTSVFARGPADAWAVGSRQRDDGRDAPLALHWDGVAWQAVDVPDLAAGELTSVAGAGTEVWAAGTRCGDTELTPCTALVVRRSGDTWQQLPPVAGTEVTGLVPFAAGDVWTVGYTITATDVEIGHVEHWDGRRFSVDPSPLPGPGGTDPNGQPASATPIAAGAGDRSSGRVWAVGWSTGPIRVPNVIYRD
ncbi:hypothetical protein [Paractinoplanes atraurantiacus]|uniref:Uncharacterized protein n=1 Tax=Paractinoplanes atraurantiacus TaxID=1036182 RepID=A0A285JIM5_9ACTN|nr:hypothetical protein [Actinoplanes atraurantiacus]SNY60180.1 hypothetical protein SAMN05421748_12167 [Actinoplanes atraurantiacus]